MTLLTKIDFPPVGTTVVSCNALLKVIKNNVQSCTKCDLHKLMPEGCKPVPGIGWSSRIILLGEALGEDESMLEEPFVGQCGQLLNKILKDAGLKREELYITNVVKCRPTDTGKKNRPPSSDEITSCRQWLLDELLFTVPKVVVTLGKIATYEVLKPNIKKSFKLSDMIGKQYKSDYTDGIIIPCQHPSWLLQYGKDKYNDAVNLFKMVKVLSDV